MTKKCPQCGDVKDASCFRVNRSKRDGLQSYCTPCQKHIQSESHQRHRLSGNAKCAEWESQNRERRSEYRKSLYVKHRARFIARVKAQRHLKKAIAGGVITKPSRCQVDGCTENKKPHAHHPYGYDGDNAIRVMFLCPLHHMQVHGEYTRGSVIAA